jgi:hypothetical protein
MSDHRPVILHDREDHECVCMPAEICEGCSDVEGGRLVPVSFCPSAAALLPPAPWY